MKPIRLLSLAAVLALAGFVAAQDHHPHNKPKNAQFEALKKLAGEWAGKANHGAESHDATVTYRVTSGGSAVVETIGPGSEHEMVTIFTVDGDDLVLTHYCMLGNQPRMKAEKGDSAITFKFVGGGNLKSDKEPHMHDLKLEIVDDNHIKTNWSFFKDGKASDTATFDLTRKK